MSKRSHVIKLLRAREHLKELGLRLDEWRKETGQRVFGEPDAEDPGYQIFYFENEPIEIERFSPVIGDVVQNLRASLDHLAVELAAAFTGPLSKKQEADLVFPIYRDEGAFRAGAAKVLGLVGSEAGAAIQRLQPCYTRPDKGPEWDLLWQLNALSLSDRQQTLPLTSTVVSRWSIESILPEGFDPAGAWFRTGVSPKGRAPIARLPLLPEGTEARVMAGITASLDVALGNPPSPPVGDPVFVVLDDMVQYVETRVISVLRPMLGAPRKDRT